MMNVNRPIQENESEVIDDEFIIDFLSEEEPVLAQDKIF